MSENKLKVIVLTHGGCELLLLYLSALETVEIAGVFLETETEPQRSLKQKINRSIRYDGYVSTAKKFAAKIFGAGGNGAGELEAVRKKQNALEQCAEGLKIPVRKVQNFHTETAIQLIRDTDADLGILYGTNIIKESVFSLPRLGSINIHQGLAPFYRGGPTVFWELFNGEREIGITVHFVASKVDTGDIILQTTLPLEYDFSRYGLDYETFFEEFRSTLKDPSARLLAEAVKLIAAGKEIRIKQDTGLGKRYRLPVKSEKDALLRLLKERFKTQKS